jgi:methyl-accepting chemotaxis protein
MSAYKERLGVWGPGILLARYLSLPLKLGILCAVIMVPLFVAAVLIVGRQNADLQLTRSELQGTTVIRQVTRLVTLVQKHRGLTNLMLSGNVAVKTDLEQTRRDLTQATIDTANRLNASPAFTLTPQWQLLASRLQALPGDTQSVLAPASFKLHTELVRDLGQFVHRLAESSGLLFDSEPTTFLLMDMIVTRTIPWTEQIGQLRGAGAGLLSKAEPDVLAEATMRGRVAALGDLLSEQQFALDVLKRNGETALGGAAALEGSRRFADLAKDAFSGPDSRVRDAAAYFKAGTLAIDAVLAAQALMIDRLEAELERRVEQVSTERTLLALLAVLGFLLLLYLVMVIYKSLMIDLRRLSFAMKALAAGNLTVDATVRAKDELGDLSDELKSMISSVSAIVATVSCDAALVADAGNRLGAGNRELSDRTEQQAASLEQTSASVQELASTVQQNAKTASDVDRQAAGVRDIAESGALAMAASIDSVEAIQKGAQRMNEIIGVIDGLAFQTNILALNAAVEAARAGESGRGFAVVASEVRSLAQRSAESSREIRSLILASRSQVEASVAQIRAAGDDMDRIVTGIRGVSASISLISTASADQSTALREISAAAQQLDEITQSNARMVERAVDESNRLEARAGSLSAAISKFQLAQGVADEAIALVERAVIYHQSSPSRDVFLRGLTQRENNFYDRDMYVFALDSRGTYLAFAGNQAKVGTRVQDVPGIDGEGLMQSIIGQAQQEPGWVEYEISNPTTGKLQHKMSFVQLVDGVYLGCGIYKALA